MSKKSWYERSHQFTPYTKADGQAVSDEFDAIQASFERIPEMRDDGKGFAVSPIIPKPTESDHPVTFGMLTESEKSVNNARDDVTTKAQQVAQNTQTVATNTQTAINQANLASQSAASALSSQQSANNSEDMARKWASNPEDQIVLGDKYSAYHYAMKAGKSAHNLSIAEQSARDNAQIAAQKAEEAKTAAKKAESLAAGEVEYEKILNVPRADTSTEGIVRLTSDTGLDSESLSLTAKAGKILSQAISAVRLALNNYIPLKNRSSSVTSNDENNVATSKAVKTAYDKGVEADNNANGRIPRRVGNCQFITQNDGNFVVTQDGKVKYHLLNIVDTLPKKLDKAGGEITGPIIINSNNGKVIFNNNRANKGYIGFPSEENENVRLSSISNVNSYIEVRQDSVFCGTNFISANDVKTSSGKSLNNAVQLSDLFSQYNGGFYSIKHPDGTLIQSYSIEQEDMTVGGGRLEKSFIWPIAFTSPPVIIAKPVTSVADGHDVGINVLYKSDRTRCYYHEYEHGTLNQGKCRVQFLAVGRWK